MKVRRLYLFFATVLITVSDISYGLDGEFLQKVKTEEQIAYTEITTGNAVEGV